MSLASVTVLGGISNGSAVDSNLDSMISLISVSSGRGLSHSSDAVVVDLDLTVLGQMALFVVLMLVLKPVLFDPMLRLFEEREKRIAGAKLEARAIDEKSAAALSQYEAAMAKTRAEANAERDRLRSEGAKLESELLERARVDVAGTLEAGRAKLSKHRAELDVALKEEVKALARDVATSALGREVRG